MSLHVPEFSEIHPHEAANAFVVTNEEPQVHRLLLGKSRYERIAAIASGGELIFSLLLPRTKTELIAIDHSTKALAACYVKCLLLEKLGVKEFKKLLAEPTWEKFKEEAHSISAFVPPALKKWTDFKKAPERDSYGYILSDPTCLGELNWRSLRTEWFYISERVLERSLKNLHKLKFIHGDLTDLPGEFDLIYVSNAFDHVSRTGSVPIVDTVASKLKAEGLVLSTSPIQKEQYVYERGKNKTVPLTTKITKVNQIVGFRTSWNHILYQKESAS